MLNSLLRRLIELIDLEIYHAKNPLVGPADETQVAKLKSLRDAVYAFYK